LCKLLGYFIIYRYEHMNLYKKIWLFGLLFIWIIAWNISNAGSRDLPWVTIISRAQWWADETIRFRSTPRPTKTSSTGEKTEEQIKAENISKIRNAWMTKNFPFERKYEWSNPMFWNHYLIYPDYYNYHKNKIIIHHTAKDYGANRTMEDVKKDIQQIYKYHTINRNFWDIWYNFLIDQMWNIYEWRAGGQWAVWMHASSNNVASIWIALMWNFQNDTPTVEQMKSLVNLTTAIARYYHIDPMGYTYTFSTNTEKEPYVVATKNPNIMWHKNVKSTACPGANLYKYLPQIRSEVLRRMKNEIIWNADLPSSWANELKKSNVQNKSTLQTKNTPQTKNTASNTQKTASKTTSNTVNKSDFSKNLSELLKRNPQVLQNAAQIAKKNYKWNLAKATHFTNKISKKYSITDVKNLMNQNISVLLYELTKDYDSFQIVCDGNCIFNIDGVNYSRSWATLTFLANKIQVNSNYTLSANQVSVKSSVTDWSVKITNYNRKSYLWIPWNSFKGSLYFEKWTYPLKNGEQKSDFIVVNTLPFSEYMKWIVETNDTETLEKNKVMAMISKNYALFYMNKWNIHPSISPDANYTAIDDPDFFQKYVWAWLEKTLTKWYQALNATKNQIVMYNWYLPILPYFNCSPGFTLSAEEKRWWNDTPYLKSVYDFNSCSDFAGHGVGLAWKWAERFAQQWMTYDQILKYYYDWIEIVDIN